MQAVHIFARPWADLTHIDGCNVRLTPIDNTAAPQVPGPINLPFTWDTGRWLVIAATGQSIDYVCVQAQGTNGPPQGGVESTGEDGHLFPFHTSNHS